MPVSFASLNLERESAEAPNLTVVGRLTGPAPALLGTQPKIYLTWTLRETSLLTHELDTGKLLSVDRSASGELVQPS